ncbi:MAG: DUF4440 domain-containing protein [Gemmatimonadaceae bacterium]|nr:DUF4440 domain-containing protein [Gemmatimonadaceae bacterium]
MSQPRIPVHALRLLSGASLLLACASGAKDSAPSRAEAAAIADTLRATVRDAYDLSKGDVVRRMMAVYPASGRVISATGGRISTSRDSLQLAIAAFWDGVGQFMVDPTWTWGTMEVDVLSRDAAVMSARYTVPHWTDAGRPHVIGGVWTTVWSRGPGGWHVIHEHLSDLPRPAAERLEATMPRRDSVSTASHGAAAHPRD